MVASDKYNTNKAYKLLIKSSDASYLEAHKKLAYWYNHSVGQKGSPELVFKYLKRAAEAGDLDASACNRK